MSNTDGEDTQRCKFNCDGPKSELNQFCGCWNELHQELASLREQLKQQEEVIRELIPIAEWGVPGFSQRLWNVTGDSSIVEMNKANAVINKAKSLTTKDK